MTKLSTTITTITPITPTPITPTPITPTPITPITRTHRALPFAAALWLAATAACADDDSSATTDGSSSSSGGGSDPIPGSTTSGPGTAADTGTGASTTAADSDTTAASSGTADGTTDDDTASDDATAGSTGAAALEIAGEWLEEFAPGMGITHVIDETRWDQLSDFGDAIFHVASHDNEVRFVVAQADGANEFNPGLWSRFDWTWDGDALYYCTAVSAEDALAAPASEPGDLESGCGGFPWSMLTPVR
jgi:hypothetical protein